MRFGISRQVITPPMSMKLACTGAFDINFTSVHDDVYIRTLVLDDGKKKLVLMSFDLLFHDRLLNDAIAEYAEGKYGIDKSSVIISYTHAHTAPAGRGYNPGSHCDEYELLLVEKGKEALDCALCSMQEGKAEYGIFDADFNISRRGVYDGKFGNYPAPDYPHDRELFVLTVRDEGGNVRSVMTNYACHPVFYPAPDRISGEFPGRLCQLIDANYYGCTSLFFQSSAGDVRPRPTAVMEGERWHWEGKDFSGVDAFAKDICKTVVDIVDNKELKPIELDIASDAFAIELPMEPASLEWFEEKLKVYSDMPASANMSNAYNIVNGGYEKLPHSMPLHCQAAKLSDSLYIATVGGEPCFGVKKAAASAFVGKDVCFIGYTDACAYIVDDRVLSEGGYEPTCHNEYGHIGPFKPGLDKLYRDNFRAAFEKISK
ncbi:MAG: hypothetical protein IJO09_01430 [Oscillospiraceae bacterium]|nr:hypothetical protein [Oscillospiraceae bacterium]